MKSKNKASNNGVNESAKKTKTVNSKTEQGTKANESSPQKNN